MHEGRGDCSSSATGPDASAEDAGIANSQQSIAQPVQQAEQSAAGRAAVPAQARMSVSVVGWKARWVMASLVTCRVAVWWVGGALGVDVLHHQAGCSAAASLVT